jgi:hypothetical protein
MVAFIADFEFDAAAELGFAPVLKDGSILSVMGLPSSVGEWIGTCHFVMRLVG